MARILAVDDSDSMRQLVAFTLESAGHSVTEASDGAAALEIAKRELFDLVVTDVNMPEMGGIELTRELRALQHYTGVPILTLTTECTPERKAEGRTAGATGWIVKPFDPDRLLTLVGRVLPVS